MARARSAAYLDAGEPDRENADLRSLDRTASGISASDILSPRRGRWARTNHLTRSRKWACLRSSSCRSATSTYNARTHHTNMDWVSDRIQPDDMRQMATVAAVFAWQAATRDEKLPRKALPAPTKPSERIE